MTPSIPPYHQLTMDAVMHRLGVDLDDADKRQLLGVRRKVPAWLAAVLDRIASPGA